MNLTIKSTHFKEFKTYPYEKYSKNVANLGW
jgi:hypothetical protein